ncbi:MAG: phosphohydrolase [Lachnospiraceae bacterium]|nr:phosphohydrolase [Lachnospiraceae bacterium]
MMYKNRDEVSKLHSRRLIQEYIYHNGKDILHSENFRKTRKHLQHGSKSVHGHCTDVAQCSLWINRKFHLNCVERDLIRGALLHDYFLYDWHNNDHEPLHGFYHPGIALRNACKEYKLSKREEDIIKKHMWPMTIVPPLCREAWVVTFVDKYCSILETLHIRRGLNRVRVNQ